MSRKTQGQQLQELSQQIEALVSLMSQSALQTALTPPQQQQQTEPPAWIQPTLTPVRPGSGLQRTTSRPQPPPLPTQAELSRAEYELFDIEPEEGATVPDFQDHGGGPSLMGMSESMMDSPDSLAVRLKGLETRQEVLAQRFKKLELVCANLVERVTGANLGAAMGR